MTNLTDITIIVDSSPRAEDLSKTDPSKPIEPNVDKSRSQPEASDASLAPDLTTITTKDNLNQKEIENIKYSI